MEQALFTSVKASPDSPIEARPSTTTTRSPASAGRLLFIDNIRWVMILFVLSMHAAVTYGGHGSW